MFAFAGHLYFLRGIVLPQAGGLHQQRHEYKTANTMELELCTALASASIIPAADRRGTRGNGADAAERGSGKRLDAGAV